MAKHGSKIIMSLSCISKYTCKNKWAEPAASDHSGTRRRDTAGDAGRRLLWTRGQNRAGRAGGRLLQTRARDSADRADGRLRRPRLQVIRVRAGTAYDCGGSRAGGPLSPHRTAIAAAAAPASHWGRDGGPHERATNHIRFWQPG